MIACVNEHDYQHVSFVLRRGIYGSEQSAVLLANLDSDGIWLIVLCDPNAEFMRGSLLIFDFVSHLDVLGMCVSMQV